MNERVKDVWDNSDDFAAVGEDAAQQQQQRHLTNEQIAAIAEASVRASTRLGESMVHMLPLMYDMGAGTISVGAEIIVKGVGPRWFRFSVGEVDEN